MVIMWSLPGWKSENMLWSSSSFRDAPPYLVAYDCERRKKGVYQNKVRLSKRCSAQSPCSGNMEKVGNLRGICMACLRDNNNRCCTCLTPDPGFKFSTAPSIYIPAGCCRIFCPGPPVKQRQKIKLGNSIIQVIAHKKRIKSCPSLAVFLIQWVYLSRLAKGKKQGLVGTRAFACIIAACSKTENKASGLF